MSNGTVLCRTATPPCRADIFVWQWINLCRGISLHDRLQYPTAPAAGWMDKRHSFLIHATYRHAAMWSEGWCRFGCHTEGVVIAFAAEHVLPWIARLGNDCDRLGQAYVGPGQHGQQRGARVLMGRLMVATGVTSLWKGAEWQQDVACDSSTDNARLHAETDPSSSNPSSNLHNMAHCSADGEESRHRDGYHPQFFKEIDLSTGLRCVALSISVTHSACGCSIEMKLECEYNVECDHVIRVARFALYHVLCLRCLQA